MYITIPRVEITLENEEVSILAYAVMRDIRRSIDTHWSELQRNSGSKLAAFERDPGTQKQLRMMEQHFAAEARPDLAIMYRKEFTETLERADRESGTA